ncbi:MAG: hypothetical protein AAGU11_17175 [Syntrophobacteraceae bacterium]
MSTNYYSENIQVLPVGLTRAVARILEHCVGHDQAIALDRLVQLANQNPAVVHADERQVRAAVEELRNDGMDVVNLMDGAGYFIPGKNEKDLYIRFRQSYTSRAKRIFETMSKMDATAKRKFGSLEENAQQTSLF